jgi:sodium-dependent dicarboxylate transporter 2/3/5
MRTRHEASASVETYSPAEERFNRQRRTWGLVLGPLACLAVLLSPLPGLSPEAHRLAAIMALVVVSWVTEAVPVAVTALVVPVLAVALRVAPARVAFAPFADPIIFLFIGSFMLAEAMFVHRLDRRIAFTALAAPAVREDGGRILLAYGVVGTAISMWVSNTATTAMLFPIGLAIASHLAGRAEGDRRGLARYGLGLMLMTSFGASVGGVATPVGTPPNLIGIGLLERVAGVRISFVQWMTLGVPVVVVLFGFLAVYLWLTTARGIQVPRASAALIGDEQARLGPLTTGERNVLVAFGLTVLLWLAPGVLGAVGLAESGLARAYSQAMPEAVAALAGAVLLFVLPIDWRARRFTLTWEQATRIDWGTVLLFGGGLTIGELAFSTGLAEAAGTGVVSLLPVRSPAALTAMFTGLAIVVSEATSNTASATMVVPVAIAVAQGAGVGPVEPALGATFGASMGFMMPVSTPPNAIVYSSGFVPITAMMRYGLALDLAGFIIIVVMVTMLGPVLF